MANYHLGKNGNDEWNGKSKLIDGPQKARPRLTLFGPAHWHNSFCPQSRRYLPPGIGRAGGGHGHRTNNTDILDHIGLPNWRFCPLEAIG